MIPRKWRKFNWLKASLLSAFVQTGIQLQWDRSKETFMFMTWRHPRPLKLCSKAITPKGLILCNFLDRLRLQTKNNPSPNKANNPSLCHNLKTLRQTANPPILQLPLKIKIIPPGQTPLPKTSKERTPERPSAPIKMWRLWMKSPTQQHNQ